MAVLPNQNADGKLWRHGARFNGMFYAVNEKQVRENFKIFTPERIRRDCERTVALGFNCLMINQKHYRWTQIDLFDAMFELQQMLVEIGHEFDLKVGDHYSSVFVFRDQPKKWRNYDLEKCLRVNSDGSVYLDEVYHVQQMCVNHPEAIAANQELAVEFITNRGADFFMCDDMCITERFDNCCCAHCRKAFHEHSGYDLPAEGADNGFWYNMESPGYRAWLRFRADSIGRYLKAIHDAIGPDKVLFACNSDQLATHVRLQPADSEALFQAGGYDMCVHEVWFGESQYLSVNWPRVLAEHEVKRAICNKYDAAAVVFAYSGNDPEGFAYQHSMAMFSLGRRIQELPGEDNDEMIQLTKRFNDFESAHQNIYSNAAYHSDVAVVFSRNTRDFYGDPTFTRVYADLYSDEYFGWIEPLLKSGVPYRVLLESDLEDSIPPEISTLILPNTACMSERACRQVEDFVKNGGTLIATHETSLFDEHGARRQDFHLAETFGLSYLSTSKGFNIPVFINRVDHPVALEAMTDGQYDIPRNTHYGRAREAFEKYDANIRDIIFAGIKTWRLGHPASQAVVRYADKNIQTLAHTPIMYRDKYGYPALALRRHGKGKVLYISGLWGYVSRTVTHMAIAQFGEEPGEFNQGSVIDFAQIITNIVHWARNGRELVKVDSGANVTAKLYRDHAGDKFHLHLLAQTTYELTPDRLHLVLVDGRTPYQYQPVGPVKIQLHPDLHIKRATWANILNGADRPITIRDNRITLSPRQAGKYGVVTLHTTK